MASKYLRLVPWLFLASATAAGAQSYQPLTVGDLDAVMQEEIYFKALAARNAAEAEFRKVKGGSSSGEVSAPAAPQLLWRRATAEGWVAKLVFSSGTSVLARAGDSLPGGFKTVSVNADAVVVSRGAETFTLSPAVQRKKGSDANAQFTTGAAPPPPPPTASAPPPEGRFPLENPR